MGDGEELEELVSAKITKRQNAPHFGLILSSTCRVFVSDGRSSRGRSSVPDSARVSQRLGF